MPVAETSRWAYGTVDLTRRQAQVMAALAELGEASDVQIAERLGWPINCVTPRRGELVVQALVVAARVVEGPNGRMITLWRAMRKQLELQLVTNRRSA